MSLQSWLMWDVVVPLSPLFVGALVLWVHERFKRWEDFLWILGGGELAVVAMILALSGLVLPPAYTLLWAGSLIVTLMAMGCVILTILMRTPNLYREARTEQYTARLGQAAMLVFSVALAVALFSELIYGKAGRGG